MKPTKRESNHLPKGNGDQDHELLKWAVEEMNFRAHGRHVNDRLPGPQDLKLQELQDNPLQKNKPLQPGEKEKLLSQYTELSSDILDLTGKVDNVQTELRHLEKELISSEKERETISKVVSDFQRRNALLEAHAKRCENITTSYKNLKTQLHSKVDAMRIERQGNDTKYYSVQRDSTKTTSLNSSIMTRDKKDAPALESSCTRKVREACQTIGLYMKDVCDHSDIDKRLGENVAPNKDQLWTQVEGILSEQASDEVLNSLVLTTQDSTTDLKDLTSQINLKKDAEELKFLLQKGELTDTSIPPSLVQSVHQLIQDGQTQHFRCFLEAEKAANEAWKLQQELKTINKNIENRMESRYKGLPGTTQLARKLYHSKLEVHAARAMLSYLQSAIRGLENSKIQKLTALETIQSKYDKIKDFEQHAQQKQSVIQALVKQNFAIRLNIEKQKHEILDYTQGKVCAHQSHIISMVTGLQHAVSCDVDKFTLVPIAGLQYVNLPSGERILSHELSIHRLEDLTNRPGGSIIGRVLEKMEFPFYKAPEELLQRIMEIKETLENAAALVEKREQDIVDLQSENSSEDIMDQLNRLQQQINIQDEFESNHILPYVQDGLKHATKALSQCIAVKDIATTWWEQPAQFLVPWVKVDDMNTRQWLDQFTLYATRLRQLQMHE